jgi:sulfate adenylyltransferase subunit 1
MAVQPAWKEEKERGISKMNGLLKFITCGSVDDGKSTLIGHILYDAKLLYADQEKALELDSKVGSRGGAIDYSLLLDGLMAEREQGITIDVAYRYFTTDNRSFIVADTPGHEEYTRNMAVGASFADLAVILVDAKQGVLVQTRRHARICALMGIRHFVFAVNKMDLIGYEEAPFRAIEAEIGKLSEELHLDNVKIIPVSATEGDNVTKKSENIPWYTEEPLLTYLENVDVTETTEEAGFYLPVQRVCRPNHEFRGFQGQIESGIVKKGDQITALPSKEQAHVKSIHVGDRELDEAFAGQPVTIQLDREVDVSRGCVLTSDADLKLSSTLTTTILWMDDEALMSGKNFLVKIGTKLIPGVVTKIHYSIDVNTGEQKNAAILNKNEIAVCTLTLSEQIVVDEFSKHKTLGELILIDRITNMTSACGVVTYIKQSQEGEKSQVVDRQSRSVLKGQVSVAVEFQAGKNGFSREFVEKTERQLASAGRHTYLYQPQQGEQYDKTVRHLVDAGIIVLLYLDANVAVNRALRNENFYYYEWDSNAGSDLDAVVDKVKKLSSFTTYISGNGDYTI